MRVVIIGGSGHVGTYLVPRLVEAGCEVIALSRGQRESYQPHAAWKKVQRVQVDREAEEAAGTFGQHVRALNPDVVIDMICFTLPSARHLVEVLRGQVQHFLFCGTVWVHGPAVQVPTTEMQPRRAFGDYGSQKAAIEAYLLEEARRGLFPATNIHPGHIVGPGWVPINPQGNLNPKVYETLARGDELPLPNLGLETLHHVHADDVAQAFMAAMTCRSASIGESFHNVSGQALTLRGYAEMLADWFGQPANLRFLSWEQWRQTVSETDAAITYDHIVRSSNMSIEKARRLIGYQPRYTSMQAITESVGWLIEHGVIQVTG